jgi:hypothetical protein
MNTPTRFLDILPLLAGAVLLAAAAPVAAADAGGWQTSASIYVYLPSVSAKTSFPVDGGIPIDVSSDRILDSLKMTFMGSLDVHNGGWGVFTDVIYLDLGNTKTQSRDFTLGNVGIPAGTTANLALDLKGWVWTLAGEYRVASDAGLTMDVIGGARMLDLKQRLDWNISGSLGPLSPLQRAGTSEVRQTIWDGIVGVKGRFAFGEGREWALPFYLDVGTGQSQTTWQAAGGISHAFKWGEISALYRYLDYEMKSGRAVQGVRFSGPMLGATFRWQ